VKSNRPRSGAKTVHGPRPKAPNGVLGDDAQPQPKEEEQMKTAKELVDQINAAEVCAPHEIEDVIDMDDVKEVVTLNRMLAERAREE
jgi:hypothetical protein